MNLRDRLSLELGADVVQNWEMLSEIRIRSGQKIRYRLTDGTEIAGDVIGAQKLRRLTCSLMENSLYAREEELKEGYFTADGGCRVGVCGKLSILSGSVVEMNAIGSVCIRIPREIKGCAEVLTPYLRESVLVLSAPGLGKTTLLRDFARRASDAGMNVAVADERREICACVDGIPQLDVGSRTDVMDGCPKALAIPMLVRSCAPDLIVVDEIGSGTDAQAILDACRCGVHVAASAHASGIEDAMRRKNIAVLLENNVFERVVVLGKRPGHIAEIRKVSCGVNAGC